MKNLPLTFLLSLAFLLSAFSCSKQEVGYNKNDLLKFSRFSITPQVPTYNDEIFLIDTICSYDKLQELSICDYQIRYVRSFNSMMGMPCYLKIDKVSLGHLKPGFYTIYYFYVDRSDFAQDTIAYADTARFTVIGVNPH